MSSRAKSTVKTYQNYVNGQWVGSSSNETFAVYDPSTEEVIANVASATAADVDKAVVKRPALHSTLAPGRKLPRRIAAASCLSSPKKSGRTPRSLRR